MGSLLVQNGRVITDIFDDVCDLYIENGIIHSIGKNLSNSADKVIDAKDMLIFPGGVDAHTHMEIPMMGTYSSDTFESGTRAAIAGGTTTIIDFANQSKGESLHVTLDKWLEKSKNAKCETRFHVSVTDVNEKTLNEMEEISNRKVTSFKTFLAYKGMRLSDIELTSVMQKAKSLNCLVTAHCELGMEIEANVTKFISEGKILPKHHPQTRPVNLEGEATVHFLDLANQNNCPAYVVHMTCKDSAEALRTAKSRGQQCYGETCPQYLLLDDSLYDQDFTEASKYILSPPLRDKSNQKSLWEAIADGTIDVVATDHCPFTTKQRALGKDNFTKIPSGLPGVEERMSLMYSEGVSKNRISLKRYVELCCSNPAKIFGLYPKKGTLQVGSDADFFILDPNQSWIMHHSELNQNVDYSCYDGMEIEGKIILSYTSFVSS